MTYPVSVNYKGNGSNYVWPLPFPFGGIADIGVSMSDDSGNEHVLEAGVHYHIDNGSLICLVPLGCSIFVWLKVPCANAEEANRQRVAGQNACQTINSGSEQGPVFANTLGTYNYSPQVASDQEMANAEAEKILAAASAKADEIIRQAEFSSQALTESQATQINAILERTARYCETLRDQTRREAAAAIKVGRQLSLYRNQPGISAVDSWENLPKLSTGLFVIVPGITHSPTPFMGIWPAKCCDDMNFDGVFFIGPPYPENVTLPPADGLPPAEMPEAALTGSDWIPCLHSHLDGCKCK